MSRNMNELEQVIQHLQAMVATMEGLTRLLRKMAARPWPDYPNGEGTVDLRAEVCSCGHVAMIHEHLTGACTAHVGCPCEGFTGSGLTESETLQGRATPATCEPPAPGEGSFCRCGHEWGDHEGGAGECALRGCQCLIYRQTLTDPRD
jgi:hypothetical protein